VTGETIIYKTAPNSLNMVSGGFYYLIKMSTKVENLFGKHSVITERNKMIIYLAGTIPHKKIIKGSSQLYEYVGWGMLLSYKDDILNRGIKDVRKEVQLLRKERTEGPL